MLCEVNRLNRSTSLVIGVLAVQPGVLGNGAVCDLAVQSRRQAVCADLGSTLRASHFIRYRSATMPLL